MDGLGAMRVAAELEIELELPKLLSALRGLRELVIGTCIRYLLP